MSIKEYQPGSAFPGVIARTIQESSPAWPAPLRARAGISNVIFIVLDDTGYGQLGCFGSPIRTPNIDRLAAGGLRYSNLHTTALCSPSRSCILTGRNHHSNAMACITEGSAGYPGQNGVIPFENGFLSEILVQQGYNTYAVGKWHLTPAEQASAAGPYDRWPLGRGFERFYGFLGGDTSQYYPNLVADNHQVPAPRTPAQGYHLTPDLVNQAIHFIDDSKQIAPDKPFFLYFCTGAMHAPHQVPREWADRYAGQFDQGWDAYRQRTHQRQIELGILPPGAPLSRHDPDVPAWGSLSADQRRVASRMMEVFAGFMEHTDHHIGRLIAHLEARGELDNTLLMLVSDNGASAEGGPTGSVNESRFFNNVPESDADNLAALPELGGPRFYNHYPWGWAWAGNTPFKRWKRETYRGGVSDPLIVHWPKGIAARGELRTQYAHVVDLVPTVLESLALEPPTTIRGVTQSPIEGVSFAHSFADAAAATHHRTQYFEMFGHRALDHDGWRAVCPYPGPSYREASYGFGSPIDEATLRQLDAHGWELYRMGDDPAETRDLAASERPRLIEMIALWYVEAGKYKVLPIDSRTITRFADERPQLAGPRDHYTYRPGTSDAPEANAVKVLNRAHVVTAKVAIQNGAEGVLLAHGGNGGGYTLFVKDHRLHYVHNYVGIQEAHLESTIEVPPGESTLQFQFQPTGQPDIAHGRGTPGTARLFIDGKPAGELQIDVTIPMLMSISEGLSCGQDPDSAVSQLYEPPFAFTGTLHEVTVDVSGDLVEDKAVAARVAMARQ